MTGSGFAVYRSENGGSLTVWFRISNSTHDVEIRNEQSQQKLNCALFVDFSLIQKFTGFTIGRRLKIGRTCVGLRAGTDYEWSDFVSTVAVSDANFSVFPQGNSEPFLTESLILAQNERWRRG